MVNKYKLYLILLVFSSLINGYGENSTENVRKITSKDGKVIDVQLLYKSDNSITFKRLDNDKVFDVNFSVLSQADIDFLKTWNNPEFTPKDSVAIIKNVKIKKKDGDEIIYEELGGSSGFIAQENGKCYFYTNQHCITDLNSIYIEDLNGARIYIPEVIQVSNKYDIARFEVPFRPFLRFSSSVKIGEKITAFGNSGGGSVITSESGDVVGISNNEIEVSANVIPGNSGGPIVNSNNEVVGIVTRGEAGSDDLWTEDTRYQNVRRFGLIPSKIKDWKVISRNEYQAQIIEINKLHDHLNQVIHTFHCILLANDYVIDVPVNYPRQLQFLLRKVNRTGGRKTYNETVTLHNIGSYLYSYKTSSLDSKKFELLRSHLRQLKKYVESELSLFEYESLKNKISIDYLIYGSGDNSLNYYAVTKTQLIKDIDSAIERLKF